MTEQFITDGSIDSFDGITSRNEVINNQIPFRANGALNLTFIVGSSSLPNIDNRNLEKKGERKTKAGPTVASESNGIELENLLERPQFLDGQRNLLEEIRTIDTTEVVSLNLMLDWAWLLFDELLFHVGQSLSVSFQSASFAFQT